MYSGFIWSYRATTPEAYILLVRAHEVINNNFYKPWILKYVLTLIIFGLSRSNRPRKFFMIVILKII
jgi:hypothetical protein